MRPTILALICMMIWALPGAALAQSEAPPAAAGTTQSYTGSVVSADTKTLVVRSDAGTEMTFQLDSYTYLPSRLMAGQKITVQYTTDVDRSNHATMVSVLPEMTPRPEPGSEESSPATEPRPASSQRPEMPATASPLWWFALIGLAAAASSLVARHQRR